MNHAEHGGEGWTYDPMTGRYNSRRRLRLCRTGADAARRASRLTLCCWRSSSPCSAACWAQNHWAWRAGATRPPAGTLHSTTGPNNNDNFAQLVAGLHKAADQAVSQPLKSDLKTLTSNYAGLVTGGSIDTADSDIGPVTGDCTTLGYSGPN